ncbi:4-(cytidine 5'-diphospho)-2-C-methyl-D-erythritol kinase [Paracidovorax avenae]|uniref:4-(cytidine 5'-diphospho)-2-C-methyl-D-erythritol kinase n=1 Tax=Paracidovorax avenae TaxID=80867 RepID=UPI001CEF5FAF|nr:4-(cytidine 5'-diphospho)-2-C-methyl-D-erythritol kinase [Paracidovorax avenae]
MRALHDLPAPAKLNLFLHITGRRPDGYHLLQSAFMLIDWCDTLHFELRADGGISREDTGAGLPADDLCTRAARALQEATGTRQGAHIILEKSIPAQAGMGGGSSDAATTLLALNRLWGLGLGRVSLERIGLSLGADIPFFLRGRNAWVEGIGETITPLENVHALPESRFVVVKPEAGLDTKSIFRLLHWNAIQSVLQSRALLQHTTNLVKTFCSRSQNCSAPRSPKPSAGWSTRDCRHG